MDREKVRKEIERMMRDYARLQRKAIDDGNDTLVAQFGGSYLALDLLLSNLGLDHKWDEEEEQEES